MIRPTAVQARANYRIWIEFEDGEQGEIDLSHLAGQGVFKAWLVPEFFQDVRIVDNDTVLWGNEIDLCPDALYMELTGKTVDEIWQRSRSGVEFSVPFAPRRGRDVGAVREPPARRGCPNALLRHRDPDALQRSPSPHFHAKYAELKAAIEIDTLAVSDGYLPPRTYGLVIEWASIHENELRAAWNRISRHETPSKISPLA